MEELPRAAAAESASLAHTHVYQALSANQPETYNSPNIKHRQMVRRRLGRHEERQVATV